MSFRTSLLSRPPILILCFSSLLPLALSQTEVETIGTDAAPTIASVPEGSTPAGISSEDWSSIRAEYDAERHAVRQVDGGYEARNPRQQWLTSFDGRGFMVTPDSSDWSWGLELLSYGYEGNESLLTGPQSISAEGGRVAYEWDGTVEEWYINDARGLEHGYTVLKPPTRSPGDEPGLLSFTLAVRGELRPKVTADKRGLCFLDAEGVVALTYAGLTAFDADGQLLVAEIEAVAGEVRILVDDSLARYPLTLDPLIYQFAIEASNGDAYDHFGWRVAISGDTLVVGAMGEASASAGVNGDQSDDSLAGAGAAYVFVRDGTGWSQQAYLKASNPGWHDIFGVSVSISGDTIVVGAKSEGSSASGIDGDQSDNSLTNSGAAYVFTRSGAGVWAQQAYIKPLNPIYLDHFGSSVAVSGDTIVVGSKSSVYVFRRAGSNWIQEASIFTNTNNPADWDGIAVAISAETLVFGIQEDSSNVYRSGAAHVYVRDGTNWSEQAFLKASNPDPHDSFGFAVAISGDTIVVGAFEEDSSALGVGGDQSDNTLLDSGAAYVFARTGTSWNQEAYLKPFDTLPIEQQGGNGTFFGWDVAVSGDLVVVAAPSFDRFYIDAR